MFLGAACNQMLENRAIEVSDGRAQVAFDVTPNLCHAGGTMHGCYYFKVLDDAASFAASSLVEDLFVLTVDFTVQLFRPVPTGRVTAVGKVTKAGSRIVFAEATARDEEGREVARGTGTFTASGKQLDTIEG